ncbi:pyrroline-5-carboxylate reductase [Erythrobacter sp. SG61-1L]|uniref:pyrroline-5-carboxylate reductase family protein n=1 Tax=Erythrobacter sp. SG61-1L TaxID=1603897 RepID=UPI0006C8E8B3|nr:pyrroline-5-carboxylate reductase [Erythrobacter sp. SG61-1L]KPL69699.1 pyrroline-5-carboxylate reductase [Erythrobacter sp. SG61-1L]
MNSFTSILLVGCGNMTGAMLKGWIAGGIAPSVFTVVNPSPRDLPEGVTQLRSLPDVGQFDAVMLGVKPQKLAEVAPQVAPLVGQGTVLLSVLAGVQLATLAAAFPNSAAQVRVMPNLAAALGKSPVALVGAGLDDASTARIDALMAPLGTAEWLTEEGLMDLVTALAGSGPAFVYRFIDALAQGAANLGLPAEQAQRLALATVEGASALAAASEHSPGELARRVASPGGVTQVGLDILDKGNALADLMEATLRGARDRSIQMAAEARAASQS